MIEKISISLQEYEELKRKADAYDRMNVGSSKGGKKTWAALTPEERSARAKKAVEARIAKYGQKSRKPERRITVDALPAR